MNIKVIGLGGVGSALCDNLLRFINYLDDSFYVTLIDGKMYKDRNKDRQSFTRLGNKATTKKGELAAKFANINFEAISEHITPINVMNFIKENDVVFMCVDNHITRKLISDYTSTLREMVLISGGNEFTDGDVQVFIRKEGKNITPSLTDYQSDIANPTDKSPHEMSCEELEKSEPQLLFANLTVATLMCWYFYDLITDGNIMNGSNPQVFFDMKTMNVRPAQRQVI